MSRILLNTKFKLPLDWEVVKLGDIIQDIADGGTPSTQVDEYFGGNIPWVNIEDITPRITDTKRKLTEEGLQNSSAKLWSRGTVIFSFGASIGKVGIAEVELCTKQGIAGIVVKNDLVSNKFLYYQLLRISPFIQAMAVGMGSTVKEIRPSKLKTIIQFFRPPPPEQQKIVYILDTIQETIGAQEKIIEKTKELKRAVMAKLFREGIKRNSKLQFKIQNLSSIADIKYGKSKPETQGNIPVVGSGGVYAYIDRPLVEKPTIVIGRKGTAGMVHLMLQPSWPSDTTFYLDLNLKVVDPKYLYEYLTTQVIIGEEAKTTLPSLRREALENIGIILLPLGEQREIAEILQIIDQKIEIEQKKKALYEELFRAMLNKLMTAEIRVKDISFD